LTGPIELGNLVVVEIYPMFIAVSAASLIIWAILNPENRMYLPMSVPHDRRLRVEKML
jgi:hypothetical protein